MPLTTIDSLQNPRIKRFRGLAQKRNRDKEGLFLLEGERELARGLQAGIEATQFLLCPELFKHGLHSEARHRQLLAEETPVVYLSRKVFEQCSYRENQDGFLACCKMFSLSLMDIFLSSKPFLLIVESIEKPGNLGSLLRTADATGVDAVILNDPVTDIFNPNVIRASAGVVFQVPAVTADLPATLEFLKRNRIVSYATTPHADNDYFEADLSGAVAIILGSEKDGLSESWIQNCDHRIRLPMHGQADSLNVSVAAAAILYEALRQRRESVG